MGVDKKNIFQEVGNFILKNIRKLFFQRKVLYGTYAENYIEVRYFLKYGSYIGLHYHTESLEQKMPLQIPKGDPEFMKAMVQERVRASRRGFRKKQESVLFYVHDNLIARLFGFRKGSCHFQFTGEYDLTKEERREKIKQQEKLARRYAD
jgi:hypothetical protein